MPLVSFESKNRVEKQHKLIIALEAECAACELFARKAADDEYIYAVYDIDWNPRTAILAVAQYDEGHTYAVYAPADLPEEQLSIFAHFLDEVKKHAKSDEQIVVFSKRSYDAIKKYSYGKPVNVQLYNK